MTMRLVPGADLDIFYAADAVNQDPAILAVVTREVFRNIFGGCPSLGFECDGAQFGGLIFDGEFPHIAVLPGWQGRWAPLFRPALRWLYAHCDDMVVPVYDDNLPLRRFIARCGWPEVGRQPGAALHRMTPMGARRVAQVVPDAPALAPGNAPAGSRAPVSA